MADTDNQLKTFDVQFDVAARATGKMRTEAIVRLTQTGEEWEMVSDEGGFHGGDGTAPLPLAYFAMGTTSCLMTQFRAFAKRLNLAITDVEMASRFRWEARQIGSAPYEGVPIGIDIDVSVQSQESESDLVNLLVQAQKGCFVEQIILKGFPIGHRLQINRGNWIDM